MLLAILGHALVELGTVLYMCEVHMGTHWCSFAFSAAFTTLPTLNALTGVESSATTLLSMWSDSARSPHRCLAKRSLYKKMGICRGSGAHCKSSYTSAAETKAAACKCSHPVDDDLTRREFHVLHGTHDGGMQRWLVEGVKVFELEHQIYSQTSSISC